MVTKIGITGGIGSGKSVVSRVLESLGVPVYIADVETRRLMTQDDCIRQELVSLLGPDVFVQGGLNKPLLASYLFASPEHAKQINGIVHPRVKEDFRRWVEAHRQHKLVGIESAILFEAGFRPEVDVAVMVYAPEEVRIERAMQRDGASRQAVEQRVRSQMDDEKKCTQADLVIWNDGSLLLLPQVLALVGKLSV